MASPVTRRGLIDELFDLLCHPNLIALLIVTLTLAILSGLPIQHPLCHTLLVGLVGSGVARAALRASWVDFGAVLGVALIVMTFARDHRAGELEVTSWRSPRDTIESYQRGSRVKMRQHLNDEFKLSANLDESNPSAARGEVTVSLGEEKLKLDYQRFLQREVFELGQWRFHHLKSEPVPDQVLLTLKFVHRVTGQESALTLEEGQMNHIDQGPKRRMVVQVAQLRESTSQEGAQSDTGEPFTQVALNAQWTDEVTGKPVNPRRIILRSDMPDYDKSFGVSPYVVSITQIKRVPVKRFKLAVRARPDYQLAWIGVALLLISLALGYQSGRKPTDA